jgi:predicted transposase YbfD/YdcC
MSEWIEEGNVWQGIQTIIEVTRKRIIKDKEQQETLYYISSLAPDIVKISDAIRGHWEVENKVHWVLDVTFKEDDCRIRKEDGAENVGIIRRFVLNLSRLHPSKISMRRKLKRAARVDEFRTEIIFG